MRMVIKRSTIDDRARDIRTPYVNKIARLREPMVLATMADSINNMYKGTMNLMSLFHFPFVGLL
jgi:hypothetical protein